MNEKNIYELFNRIDIEDEIKEYENISEFEKKKIKNNIKNDKRFVRKSKKNSYMKYASIAAAGLIVFSSMNTATGRKIYAKTMSGLDNISTNISQLLNTNNDVSNYSTTVNKVIEHEGVNIKLQDVILDGNQLIITSLIEVEDPNIDSVSFDYNIKINGKTIKDASSSGSIGLLDKDSNIYSDIRYIDLNGNILKDDINIDLSINKLLLNDNNNDIVKKVKGDWNYNFISNNLELSKDTTMIPLNDIFNIDNNRYELQELVLNPVSQIIKGKILNNGQLNKEIKLEGIDDLGNKVTFDLSSSDGVDLIFKYNNYDNDLKLDFKEIKLNIYTREYPKENGKLSGDWIKLDKNIIINK